MTLRTRRALTTLFTVASALLIAGATLTPRGGQWFDVNSSRFCIWCGPARMTDAIANVVLFVPMGFAFVWSGMSIARSTATCLLMTIGVEALQFSGVPPGRTSSVSDVITNALGGLIGALIAHHRYAIAFPRPRIAVRWVVGWSAAVAAGLAVSGWAISAPADAPGAASPAAGQQVRAGTSTFARETDDAPAWHVSPLPFTPGYGWFSGTVLGAMVDGVVIPHRGNGPVIAEGRAGSRTVARLAVVGPDARTTTVPMLYVHGERAENPEMVVAQRGDALVLRASTRARGLDISSLYLRVPGVFPEHEAGEADTTDITATVSRRELTLAVSRRTANGTRRWSATQSRLPTYGWAMIQSLVPVSSPLAWPFTASWLVLLLFPVGFWAWRAGAHRAATALCATIAIAAAMIAVTRWYGIADPPPWQWLMMAGGLCAGLFVAMLTSAGAPARRLPAAA